MVDLRLGDCLELMKDIPDGSVDLVLTDPPYNIGKGKWDKIPNYIEWCGKWLKECQRILKPSGTLYLWHNDIEQSSELVVWIKNNTDFVFNSMNVWDKGDFRALSWKNPSCESDLRTWFNTCEYCYCFVKKQGLSANDCNKAVRRYGVNYNLINLRNYFKSIAEFIGAKSTKQINEKANTRKFEHAFYVFGRKAVIEKSGKYDHQTRVGSCQWEFPNRENYNELTELFNLRDFEGFREYDDLLKEYNKSRYIHNVDKEHNNVWKSTKKNNGKQHSCKKPIDILERIIKVSSNYGDMVVDLFMGSGSTGVACVNTNRRFIGIELDEGYFNIAKKRIEEAQEQSRIET